MSNGVVETKIVSLATVANVTDVVFKVMKEIAGNDISSTINGSKVSKEILAGLIHDRIRKTA